MTSFLHQQRINAVRDAIRKRAPKHIMDLGCGDGALLKSLLSEDCLASIVAVDHCPRALDRLRDRVRGSNIEPDITLVHGCATQLRLEASRFDCIILLEVIEHIASDRLSALERSIFSSPQPNSVIVTTPNAEFNSLLGVPARRLRHHDHQFEWDRARFQRWARGTGARHGYDVSFHDIGGHHPVLGGASQMAIFDLRGCDRQIAA